MHSQRSLLPCLLVLAAVGGACSSESASVGDGAHDAGTGGSGASHGGTGGSGASDGGTGGSGASDGGTGGSGAAPARIWGVTVDDVDGIADIVDALGSLSRKPTARIVFDENMQPDYYVDPAAQIHGVSFVMGEILDSEYVPGLDLAGYQQRTSDYLAALGDDVDLWEVGNEINGEWLGNTPDVVAKMSAAYGLVKGAGKRAALTLYYNPECWDLADHEMFAWADANVPAEMKNGLDVVLVSYYAYQCNDYQPDWPAVFAELGQMFPSSELGIGECGIPYDAAKAALVDHYYRLSVTEPRFVGGYFWWWFREDMVPKSLPLWSVLDAALAAGP